MPLRGLSAKEVEVIETIREDKVTTQELVIRSTVFKKPPYSTLRNLEKAGFLNLRWLGMHKEVWVTKFGWKAVENWQQYQENLKRGTSWANYRNSGSASATTIPYKPASKKAHAAL